MNMTIRGLDEIQRKMERFPGKFQRAARTTMEAALLFIWSKVPSYPAPPSGSDYVRTGQLGRSLGSSAGGGQTGEPDIYEVKSEGGFTTGRFGTNLGYAQYVIGDREIEQAQHMSHWWTIPQTLRNIATMGIEKLFRAMGEELTAWLNSKGV
jgi:hypothetical protein